MPAKVFPGRHTSLEARHQPNIFEGCIVTLGTAIGVPDVPI